MRSTFRVLVSATLVAGFGLVMAAAASAQSRATEHTLKSTDHGPYFVIPPRDDTTKRPALLVVMPGGPGTRDFLPFVENGILGAAPKDTLGVMVTAPKWTDAQKIVWPYDAARVKKMRYPVDRYVLDVVKRVQKEHHVD
ncbi:MAG: hypothetical protein NXI31_26050, partial [bacterium]|nr:hypothetical protein [bacterium]